MERRLALGALLVSTTLLPVQVPLPGLPPAMGNVFPGDLALGASILAFTVAVARAAIPLRLGHFGIGVAAYLLLSLPSVVGSEAPMRSAPKWGVAAVCAVMALLAVNLVDTEAALRKMAIAWTIGTALTVTVALAAVVLFYLGGPPGVVERLTSDYGSLPPGYYPRVAALIQDRQPNLLCHYLSIGLLLLCACGASGWINRSLAILLGAGILVVIAFTESFGIGGVALGLAWWAAWNPSVPIAARTRRLLLAVGVAIAAIFVVLIVGSPEESLFAFRARPSARVGCWRAAWAQFLEHPIDGRGMGLEPACPTYVVASGITTRLRDSHNLYLSVASTTGLTGAIGLAGMIWVLLRRSIPLPRPASAVSLMSGSLAIAFTQAWLYQGLAASYEYTRHGWMLMGLLAAAQNLSEREGTDPGPRGRRTDPPRRVTAAAGSS